MGKRDIALQVIRNTFLVSIGVVIGFFAGITSGREIKAELGQKKVLLSPLAQFPVPTPTITPVVLGVQIGEREHFKIPTLTPTIHISPTVTPTPTRTFQKKSYVISLVGDSMTETCGEGCPYLYDAIHLLYPSIGFKIYNKGFPSSDIGSALSRLTSEYNFNGIQRGVFLDEPDIIVVESCAYNHWSDSQSDLDNYWLTLAHIADAIRASGKKVLFLATIAPNSAVYAKSSAAGASWSEEGRWDQARLVRLYLDTFIRFAKNQNIPLVDVYHESLDTRGEGDLLYINKSDYIHPSVAGFRLIADLLARGIGNLLY